MVVAASLVIEQRKGSVGASGYKVVRKKNYKVVKRKMKRQIEVEVEVVPRTLQRLFHTCREVFKGHGTVPLMMFKDCETFLHQVQVTPFKLSKAKVRRGVLKQRHHIKIRHRG